MILISKTATGLLVQRDEMDIQIDAPAVRTALGPIIAELIGSGKALSQARREGYEDGLCQGRVNAQIEQATRERIAEKKASDLIEILVGVHQASAA